MLRLFLFSFYIYSYQFQIISSYWERVHSSIQQVLAGLPQLSAGVHTEFKLFFRSNASELKNKKWKKIK